MDMRPRADWSADRAPSAPLAPFEAARLTHIVGHWPGSAGVLAGLSTAALLRGWRDWHMDGRGWRFIGYNYAVDAAGQVWELRGWNVGGHVLGEQNARSVGVVFVLGVGEPMSDAMRDAGAALFAWIEDKAGRGLDRIGHCDWANKACPGPDVLGWIRQGARPASSGIPTPAAPLSYVGAASAAPAFPLADCDRHGRAAYFGKRTGPDHSVSGYSHRQADGSLGHDGLFRWQERMAWRGWRITPDGLYGDETARVARTFQAEKRLAVDGLVGRQTWSAAWTEPVT